MTSYLHPSWKSDTAYEDDRRAIAKCNFCGADIKGESEHFYKDKAYYFGGEWACEGCKDLFLEQFQI